MNRWTEEADSVPGLVQLYTIRHGYKYRKLQKKSTNMRRGDAAPEVVAQAIGIAYLVVGRVADVEHVVGVEVSERLGTILYLGSQFHAKLNVWCVFGQQSG